MAMSFFFTDNLTARNKNAFQYDAHRPLQCPSDGGGCMPGACLSRGVSVGGIVSAWRRGVSAQGGVCLGEAVYPQGGVHLSPPWTDRHS